MSLGAGTQIGKYVVRRKLAEGGMAEIYLASFRGPEGFEKDVVIKRVRPMLAEDEAFVQMFIEEARLASRLAHANVVQIFDFDKHEDTYYLAMEYVRGQSLWAARRRAKDWMRPMTPTLVAQVGMEVARGLHYAHRLTERGVPLSLVHRDVTPHNVLLSYEGAIKLTDFGIAKAGNRLTTSGMLKGKFAYMSPEQARGESVDARTDVFALGIVLWELLTGGRLFEGESDIAVLRAVQDRVIPPPARLNPDVPAVLDAVVMRALDRDLATRFGSAQDLERALAQFLLGAARAIEDTDVGAYLRQLFPDESAASEERAADLALPVGARALSPDEDPHHPTLVLPRTPAPSVPPAPTLTRRPARLVGAVLVVMAAVAAGVLYGSRVVQSNRAPLPPSAPIAQAPPTQVLPPPPSPPPLPSLPESPSPEATPRATTVAGKARASRPAGSVVAPSPSPPEGEGTLTLRVKPWAKVFVDGRFRADVQGTRLLHLPAGEHTVRLTHEKAAQSFHVSIRDGKDASISYGF